MSAIAIQASQQPESYPSWCFYLGITCNVDSHRPTDPAARQRLMDLSTHLPEILSAAAMNRVRRAFHLERIVLPDLRTRLAPIEREIRRIQALIGSTPDRDVGAIAVFHQGLEEQYASRARLMSEIAQADHELSHPPSRLQLGLPHIEGIVVIPSQQTATAGMPRGGARFVPSCREGYGPQATGFLQIDSGSGSEGWIHFAQRLRAILDETRSASAVASALSAAFGLTQIQGYMMASGTGGQASSPLALFVTNYQNGQLVDSGRQRVGSTQMRIQSRIPPDYQDPRCLRTIVNRNNCDSAGNVTPVSPLSEPMLRTRCNDLRQALGQLRCGSSWARACNSEEAARFQRCQGEFRNQVNSKTQPICSGEPGASSLSSYEIANRNLQLIHILGDVMSATSFDDACRPNPTVGDRVATQGRIAPQLESALREVRSLCPSPDRSECRALLPTVLSQSVYCNHCYFESDSCTNTCTMIDEMTEGFRLENNEGVQAPAPVSSTQGAGGQNAVAEDSDDDEETAVEDLNGGETTPL